MYTGVHTQRWDQLPLWCCNTVSSCYVTISLYHCIILSLYYLVTYVPPYHCIIASSPGPSLRGTWGRGYTVSLHRCTTALLYHRITVSFYIVCIPLYHHITRPPDHRINQYHCTMYHTLYHCITISPCHCMYLCMYHRIIIPPYHCITLSTYHCKNNLKRAPRCAIMS